MLPKISHDLLTIQDDKTEYNKGYLLHQHPPISHVWGKCRDPTDGESFNEQKNSHLPLFHSESWKCINKSHCIQQAPLYPNFLVFAHQIKTSH